MPCLQIEHAGEVTIVRFAGDRVLDQGMIDEIGKELTALVEGDETPKAVTVSFRGLRFFSSAALGKLITLDKRCKQNSLGLRLAEMHPDIEEVFTITKLNRVFDIHPDEAAALTAFGVPR